MHVLQLVINGIMAGTILAVPAIGLTAIFAVLRFTNFALASHATIGAFAGYVANAHFGLPILPSVLAAFLIAGMVASPRTSWCSSHSVPPASSPRPSAPSL